MLCLEAPRDPPLVTRELSRVIRQLADEGVSVMLVEQNLKMAEAVADRLFIVVKGRVVYDASPERFRQDEPTIRSRYLTL